MANLYKVISVKDLIDLPALICVLDTVIPFLTIQSDLPLDIF